MSKVAIIIPCYNEEHRLPIEKIGAFIEQHSNVSICLVNDGSSDKTADVIGGFAQKFPNQVMAINLGQNAGKAEAIRQGMIHVLPLSDAEWFGYWDADLATPLDEIDHLLSYANQDRGLLMCSRLKRLGAPVERHLWRHYLGRVMATLISLTLKLPVYDTQCGEKLIRREVANDIFSEKFISRWLFDVEIIARIQQKHPDDSIHSQIVEVPVNYWKDVSGSKMLLGHMFYSLVDLVKIYFKLRMHRN